jgi:murein DD-endopeptidase MepM/ murein hydrolase activator NlpD
VKNQKKLFFILGIAAILSLLIVAIFVRSIPTIANMEYEHSVAVRPGDTLSGILRPHDLSDADVFKISKLFGAKRKIMVSDLVKITRPEPGAPVSKIIIQSGPWQRTEFAKTGGEWEMSQTDIESDIEIVLKSGEIRDGDSFYSAGMRAGIPEAVLADAYDLLAFEIDFERDMREGQLFSILYEENYAEGQFVNTGNIIALSFDAGRRGLIKMYRFAKSDGRAGYYDESGGGAIKSLKRTPINNARVTSSFSGNRKHPVLGYTRAHRGVDFRAAEGTPIPSAGNGQIVERKTNAGYGNYVRIRHNATYETLYAHLSRFKSGVNAGTHVRQGQIIGYAGSTGIATGAHLHYEIIKNGQRVNPMVVKLPAIDNLDEKDKAEFLELRKKIDRGIEFLRHHPTLVIYQ